MIRSLSVERLKEEETLDLNTKMVQKVLVNCYNRGCGQKFDPNENEEELCFHHPGEPVFHDAYKGWSCCNKKCTDFTEFLNIKGCTRSHHSDVKPPEPEKPIIDKSKAHEVIEVRAQSLNTCASKLERPNFHSSCVLLKPTISPGLLEQMKESTATSPTTDDSSKINIGQNCQNKACKGTYQGAESDKEICRHHPGEPIFHEGLKYWSCCQKRTTDFSAFLEQPGCVEGEHLWISKAVGSKINCRLDWHQTGSFVYISIYAKKYNATKSSVKLNPIHLIVDLHFMDESSSYNLDSELFGIVDVEESVVNMLPTKVEIKLKKKEPGSWTKLEIPRANSTESDVSQEDSNTEKVNAVDLSDL